MQLSDAEKQLVARLQRRAQRLVRWRWFLLISAVIFVGIGCSALAFAMHFISGPEGTDALLVACMLPLSVGLLAVGIALAGVLLYSWNGKLETRLLLGLIERLSDDD